MSSWARIDTATKRILLLAEQPLDPPPSGQQDVALPIGATTFAYQSLGGQPQEWTLDPVTLSVSHDFKPQPTSAEIEKAKNTKNLTVEERIKRLETLLGAT